MSRENAVRSGSYAVTALSRKRGRVGGPAQCPIIGMAGTSPVMTKWARHELCACYIADLLL
jgi:hypothetical protein